MKRTKIKIISSMVMLLFTLVALTVTTYAFWNYLTHTESNNINLSSGDEIIVELNTSTSGLLIPATQTPTSGEVTEISYTFNVKANQQALDGGFTNLNVSIENLNINGITDYNYLINTDLVLESTTITTSNQLVTLTITLTEPSTQIEYEAIKGGVISLDLVFTLEV